MGTRIALAPLARTGPVTTAEQPITWNRDGWCLLPRYEVDDALATRPYAVICELEDLDQPGVWNVLSRRVYQPLSRQRDGTLGRPASLTRFRVWDQQTGLPKAPRSCRISIEPVEAGRSVTLGLTVEDTGEQRDPSDPLPLLHRSVALVQEIDNANTTAQVDDTQAFAGSVTAGNCIAALLTVYNGTQVAVIDAPVRTGDTYSAVAIEQGMTVGGDRITMRGFVALNVAAGTGAITYSTNDAGTDNYYTVSQQEWSGVATTSALDDTAQGAGTSTAPTAGEVQPTTDGQVIITFMTFYNTSTLTAEGAPWAELTNLPDNNSYQAFGVVYDIQTTAANDTHTWTLGTSRQWIATAFTLKAAAGGTPVSQTLVSPVEALSRPGATSPGPIESLSRPGATVIEPLEALAGAGQTAGSPLEALSAPVALRSLPVESLARPAGLGALPIEAVSQPGAVVVLPLEGQSSAAQTVAVVIEALAGVGQTGVFPWEATSSLVAVASTAPLPIEALSSPAAALTLPWSSIAAIAALAGGPVEALSRPGALAVGPLEGLSSATQLVVMPVEVNGRVVALAVFPWEVTSDFVAIVQMLHLLAHYAPTASLRAHYRTRAELAAHERATVHKGGHE